MNWTYNLIRLQWNACSSYNIANISSLSKYDVSIFSSTCSLWISNNVVCFIWNFSWYVESNYYNSTKKHLSFRSGAASFHAFLALKQDFISMKCGPLGSWKTMTQKKRKRRCQVPFQESLIFIKKFNDYIFQWVNWVYS